MSGLYDRVQRSPRQKTFPWWAVILAIALPQFTIPEILTVTAKIRDLNRGSVISAAFSRLTLTYKV